MDGSRCPKRSRAQRVVISEGDVCWASLPLPVGSGPGFRRPVVIVQGDAFNASRISTAVVVPLTSAVGRAAAPGDVLLSAKRTGLPRDSVANVSRIVAVDRSILSERVGRLSSTELQLVLAGIDLMLGRE
jgi:mRNA interferase MazF